MKLRFKVVAVALVFIQLAIFGSVALLACPIASPRCPMHACTHHASMMTCCMAVTTSSATQISRLQTPCCTIAPVRVPVAALLNKPISLRQQNTILLPATLSLLHSNGGMEHMAVSPPVESTAPAVDRNILFSVFRI